MCLHQNNYSIQSRGIVAEYLPRFQRKIDHFTVGCLVTWPLNEDEAGVDLV